MRLKVTVPKVKKIDFDKELKGVGKSLARRVHKTYDELVKDWRDDGKRDIDIRPEFVERIIFNSRGMKVEVKTDNLKYRYVDLGTDPHDIPPRPDNPYGMLIFPSDFTPHTKPQTLGYDTGAGKSGPTTFTPYVEHPGIEEPRMFEIPIIEEQKPIVVSDIVKIVGSKMGKLVETETL